MFHLVIGSSPTDLVVGVLEAQWSQLGRSSENATTGLNTCKSFGYKNLNNVIELNWRGMSCSNEIGNTK